MRGIYVIDMQTKQVTRRSLRCGPDGLTLDEFSFFMAPWYATDAMLEHLRTRSKRIQEGERGDVNEAFRLCRDELLYRGLIKS